MLVATNLPHAAPVNRFGINTPEVTLNPNVKQDKMKNVIDIYNSDS